MWYGVQRELDVLLRGVGEEWTAEGVLDAIKCDHGYSASSPTVLAFVAALTDLSAEERRALLRFVTGSPRLPPGGLAALRPRLTIVKKHAHGPGALLHAPPFIQQRNQETGRMFVLLSCQLLRFFSFSSCRFGRKTGVLDGRRSSEAPVTKRRCA